MNALLKEYRAWRDAKIENAFEEPVTDWNELKEYVENEVMDFHYQYNESITLRQYKQVQEELVKADEDLIEIINNPLIRWCFLAIEEDDWDKLFNDNEPQTEEE